MAKKKRRLEQYVNTRRKNPEVVLAERAQLSNRIFRLFVGVALTILLAFLIRPPDVPQSAGLAIFLVVVTLLGGFCLHRLQPAPSSAIELQQVRAPLCFEVGLCASSSSWDGRRSLAPLALFAMVVTLAYSQTTALLAVFGLAFIHGLTSPRLDEMQLPVDATLSLPSLLRVDLPLVLVLTAGALTSSLGVRRVREQSKPVFVGLYAGVVQALMVLAMELMSRNFDPSCLSDPFQVRALLRDPGWAFLGGLVSGGMLTCLLPQVERFFDFVTERRLLELADPSNELLRVLRDRAPARTSTRCRLRSSQVTRPRRSAATGS
jgi:membrane-associated HD superfamily phosphohydrolase